MKQLSLFDIQLLSEPIEAKNKTVRISAKDLCYTDTKTGEKVKDVMSFIHKTELIDKSEFLKIYAKGYAFLFNVELLASIELLAVIMKIAQSTKDTNIFPLSFELAQQNGFKKKIAQYSRAKKELEQKQVILKIDKYHHKYNPTMFFNGNRIAIVQEILSS